MIIYKHYDLFLLGAIASPLLLDNFIVRSQTKRIITFSLAILLGTYFSLNLLNILPPSLSSFFQDRIRINAVADNDVALLAQKFQKLSPENALVLVPPMDEEFRFYSQRSIVFTFKSFPFTDAGITIWRDRLETLTGTKDFSNFDLSTINSFYSQQSNDELIALAKKFNANYILTSLDWHENLNGTIIEKQGNWIIYQVS